MREITWRTNMDEALREAEKTGRPIFLDFFWPT